MQVAKWGNSLAVRLPRALVDSLGLKVGDEVAITSTAHGVLEVEKASQREAAFSRIVLRQFKLPIGYKFDRDEANAR